MNFEEVKSIFRDVRLPPYGVALLSVAVALGLTRSLLPWLYPTTTPLFFIAVILSTWYGGLGPGLLATVLATLAINYFLISPLYSLELAHLGTLMRLSILSMAAVAIATLNQSRRTAIKKAQASLQTLQEAMEREQQARAVSEAAESAAQTAKAQLETILSSINNGFYVLDRNWHFTYVNDRLCEIVSMNREQLLGNKFWDLFADTVDTDIYVQFHQAFNEQTPINFEYFYSS